jgi:acyl-coenzyme A synthetase/AMP-(fatty) acid ligase
MNIYGLLVIIRFVDCFFSEFGPKRDEVTGYWRKLHNEELHNLYSSPSVIRMIKSRRMRWVGHVERMGD